MRPATHLPMENEYVPQVYGRGWQESDLVSEQRSRMLWDRVCAAFGVVLALLVLWAFAAGVIFLVQWFSAPPHAPNTLSAHRTAPTAGLETLAGWSLSADSQRGRLTAVRRPT